MANGDDVHLTSHTPKRVGESVRLSDSASFLLDVIRFSAALIVVFSHTGLPEMSTGFRDRQDLGVIAVPVFFVLSGFVIRFITSTRDSNIRAFYIDRAARMYSVVLPAMALTVVLAFFCWKSNPVFYTEHFEAFYYYPIQRVMVNLMFLSQAWGHTVVPLINIPFWSLSYECLYYVAYGLLFFLRGAKRVVAFGLWAVLAGPQILFLLPIWYAGCLVYDMYQHLRFKPSAPLFRLLLVPPFLVMTALYSLHHNVLVQMLSAIPHPLTLFHLGVYRATMMAFCTGIVAAEAMLLFLLWSDCVHLPPGDRWSRKFRHLADGTFTLYLLHYPLMVTASALGWLHPYRPLQNTGLIVVICVLCVSAARPLDALKETMRKRLRNLIPARDTM